MIAFVWNLALLALAVPALAIPAPTESVDLGKRTISDVMNINCQGVYFQDTYVEASAQKAANHLKAGTTVGNNRYPHVYRNRPENFQFQAGCNAPYYEFPLMSNGRVYNGGDPKADRVVIGSWVSGTANAKLCGGVTHRGATGNGFKQCSLY
ncbi:hypothetical protein RSOLAG22IIIB_10998 [Rhizoctonia solani]|uniref:Uncharacterized protein n=1 Tax=Rhizoctonia solani TaxID=456999 RepID=A0A0K6G6R1_9AGAM|nr:hypothetical protein RSOLAG22IIIB_10998 [Rhizoctonia solani]